MTPSPLKYGFLAILAGLPLLSNAQDLDRKVLDEPGLLRAKPETKANVSNLFLNAKVTTSGHFGNDVPAHAVDGVVDGGKFWACENLPVWYQIDMGAVKPLEQIKLWMYWEDGRIYKYKIEGSADGESWKTLVDQTANSIAGTSDGNTFNFASSDVRYVKVTVLENTRGAENGGHIVEIQGYEKVISGTLKATAFDDLERLPWTGDINIAPLPKNTIKLAGWRGERVNAQILVQADQKLSQLRVKPTDLLAKGGSIKMSAQFVKFTKGAGKPQADIISNKKNEYLDQDAGINRTVWVSVDIPADAKPGTYKGEVTVAAKDEGSITVPVEVEVQGMKLPKPSDWKVHLDIWQHPESVARIHNVELWSDEHFAIMKPLMKRLADAGQKVISASVIHEAWGGQTYDHWESMVEWIRGKDGKMRWDYTNFDKWVSFMINEVGIKDQISCYTMIPWSMKVRVFDEATGEYIEMDNNPGDANESYEKLWGPFLTDFSKHVKAKGWEKIACIAIDERPDKMVRDAKRLIDKYAPHFKIASAVNNPSALSDLVYDLSPVIYHMPSVPADLLAKRKAEGAKTTFYVCCAPAKPNTFTASLLAESEWIGMFSAVHDLDGFLRWAYNSWGRNPFEATNFVTWQCGDCFMVYPNNMSSLRFEKLRDGLEVFEKFVVLRNIAKKNPKVKSMMDAMEPELLELFHQGRTGNSDYLKGVRFLQNKLEEISAEAAK